VTKKNKKAMNADKTKHRPPALKNNHAKNRNKVHAAKGKGKVFARRGCASSPEPNGVEKGRKSVDSVCSGGSDDNRCNKINDSAEITLTDYDDQADTGVNDHNNSLRWLEEQDLHTLLEKQSASVSDKSSAATSEKIVGGRKSNIAKANANPYKKQKKISFLIDKQVDDDSKFERKPPEHEEATKLPDSVVSEEASCEKSSSNGHHGHHGLPETISISAQASSSSQIDDVLSWMDVHRTTSSCSISVIMHDFPFLRMLGCRFSHWQRKITGKVEIW